MLLSCNVERNLERRGRRVPVPPLVLVEESVSESFALLEALGLERSFVQAPGGGEARRSTLRLAEPDLSFEALEGRRPLYLGAFSR